MKYVSKGPSNNNLALVQIMARRQALSELMMISLLYIYWALDLNELNIYGDCDNTTKV